MQVLEERRTSTQTELTRIRNTIYEIAGSLGPDGVRQQHAALLQEFREYEVSIKHTILALAEEGVQVPIGDASEESEVNDSAGAAAPATSVAKLRNRLKQFRAFHEQTKDALTDMTRKKLLIENLEEDAAGAKKNLALVKQRIDALNLESRFSRIEVISDGGEPVPVSETRRRGREQSRSCS